ncbi:hypothetical protein [Kytococcus sedentarius]|uniref:hypothetical protein n=1 Tax=Kytococcus sedentarius TaxID=1276 RepID=UPI0019502548|nr:hypothetical protein [Kytococcus sedentarius]QRO88183.1 hypothetical protein I6J30_04380 [Kytococcus sedentarius]
MAWQQIASRVGRIVTRRLVSRGVRAGMNKAQGSGDQQGQRPPQEGSGGQPPRQG